MAISIKDLLLLLCVMLVKCGHIYNGEDGYIVNNGQYFLNHIHKSFCAIICQRQKIYINIAHLYKREENAPSELAERSSEKKNYAHSKNGHAVRFRDRQWAYCNVHFV